MNDSAPLVQIVITRRKDGQIRIVEFSPSCVIDTKQCPQLEVAMMVLRKRIKDLTAIGGFDV